MTNLPLLIATAFLAFALPGGLAASYDNEINGAIAAVRKEILNTGKPEYKNFGSFNQNIKRDLQNRIKHNDKIGITNAINSITEGRLVNIFIEFELLRIIYEANKDESIVKKLSEETSLDEALKKYSSQRILLLLYGHKKEEDLGKLIKNALDKIRSRKNESEQILHDLTAKIQKVHQEKLHGKGAPSASSSTSIRVPAHGGRAGMIPITDMDHFGKPDEEEKHEDAEWFAVEHPVEVKKPEPEAWVDLGHPKEENKQHAADVASDDDYERVKHPKKEKEPQPKVAFDDDDDYEHV